MIKVRSGFWDAVEGCLRCLAFPTAILTLAFVFGDCTPFVDEVVRILNAVQGVP